MRGLRSIPIGRLNPLGRVPMLGRARLGQVPQQPGLSPADNLLQNGATLQAVVGPPSASGGGKTQTFNAMIDSGASISCITMQGAQAVGLPQVSSTQLGGVGGMTNSPVYGAAITLPQFGVTVDPVQIAGVANPLPNVDMLIGRDILDKNLNFNYHGGLGSFTLSTDSGTPAATPGAAAPAAGAPVPTAPTAAAPAPSQPIPTQPMQGMPAPSAPMGQAPAAAPPPPPPQGNLPQPPASSGGILGMSPGLAAGVGAGILAAGAGALKIFKVI